MKKNIKVNVSGMLFNLDEDAYQVLETYLNRLERHFSNTDGSKEIIEDIERGIADMMNSKLINGKTIINIEDITIIIKAMGEPGEIDDESDTKKENYNFSSSTTNQKRLYRDSDDKVIAGVCSGISHYLNIDVAWIRILFVVLFFISGTGLLVYLVLWIAVPEAISTAQKLEMRGEPMNIDNIEKKIKEEFNNIGDQLNNLKNKHFTKKKSDYTRPIRDLSSAIIRLIVGIAKVFIIVVGVGLTIAAVALLTMLLPAFLSGSGEIFHVYHNLVYFSIPDAIESITISNSDYNLILYSIVAVTVIPLLSIILAGLGYLFGFRNEAKGINKAFGVIWFVGLILLVISIIRTADDFEQKETVVNEIELNLPTSQQNLYLKINPNLTSYSNNYIDDDLEKVYDAFDNEFLIFRKDSLYYSVPEMETFSTDDSIFSVKVVRYSHGDKRSIAKLNALNIEFPINIKDSIIEIPPLFNFPENDCWRNQKVKIRIYIPKDKAFILLENKEIKAGLFKEIERELHYFSN